MTQPSKRRAELEDQASSLRELPPALVEQFSRMAMMLPEIELDGGAGIIESILNAVDLRATNRVFERYDAEQLVGKWLIFERAQRAMSEYKGGLGLFLVVDAVDEESGEKITFTTGSMSIVAQCVKAYAGDEMPFRAKIKVTDNPTKSGFYPMNLEIHAQQPQR